MTRPQVGEGTGGRNRRSRKGEGVETAYAAASGREPEEIDRYLIDVYELVRVEYGQAQ